MCHTILENLSKTIFNFPLEGPQNLNLYFGDKEFYFQNSIH